MSGEVSIPQQLLDFYLTLLGGCNQKRKSSVKCAGNDEVTGCNSSDEENENIDDNEENY